MTKPNPPLPTLASDLLAKAQAQAKQPASKPNTLDDGGGGSSDGSDSSDSNTLKTSFQCIDHPLNTTGLLKYGRITNIQCDVGGYGTLLAHHLITTHLLHNSSKDRDGDESKGGDSDNATSQVAYVDTTGAFSAINLLKVLEFRLLQQQKQQQQQQQKGKKGEKTAATTTQDLRRQAVELLDRVQYMRTFDYDGVVETVSEVFGCNNDDSKIHASGDEGREDTGTGVVPPAAAAVKEEAEPAVSSASSEEGKEEEEEEEEGERRIIPDSDADSDDEIFWPLPLLPKHDPGLTSKKKRRRTSTTTTNNNIKNNNVAETESAATAAAEGALIIEEPDVKEAPVPPAPDAGPERAGGRDFGVIVFDNISRPLESLLLEENDVQANSSLTLLSRSLRSLARDRGVAILLLSTPTIFPPTTKDQKREMYIKNHSVFGRIQPTDGLPRTLTWCLDYSIMVSRYPQNQNDISTAHRRRSGGKDKFIIEVVVDRYGGGVGRWGGFAVKGDIEFVGLFKEEKSLIT